MNKSTIIKSELIETLAEQQPHLAHRDVELAVKKNFREFVASLCLWRKD